MYAGQLMAALFYYVFLLSNECRLFFPQRCLFIFQLMAISAQFCSFIQFDMMFWDEILHCHANTDFPFCI